MDVLEKNAVSLETMAMRYDHYVAPSGDHVPGDAGAATYFIEKNGAYYHGSSECYGLRSASRRVECTAQPHSRLQPCPNRQCITKQHVLQTLQASEPATDDARARGAVTSSLDYSSVTDMSNTPGASETVVSRAIRKDGALSSNSRPRDDKERYDTAATVRRIVTTMSGKYYHADRGCLYLRKARELFEVAAVKPHLVPCPLCWRGECAPVDVARPSVASGDRREMHVLTTRTGKYYHEDSDCQYLRRASEKIKVKGLPTDLAPCPKCFGRGAGSVSAEKGSSWSKVANDASQVSSVSSTASSAVVKEVTSQHSPRERRKKYITTRTGKYFHMSDDCIWLRRAKGTFCVSTVPSNLMACPKCREEDTEQEAFGSPVSVIPAKRRPHVQEKKDKDNAGVLAERSQASFKEKDNIDVVTKHSQARAEEKHNTGAVTEHSQAQPNARDDIGDKTEYSKARLNGKDDSNDVTEYSHAMLTKEASLAPFGSTFYRTRTGTKFHVDEDCRYIRGRETFSCSPLHEQRDPCRGCALGLFQEWAMAGWTTGK